MKKAIKINSSEIISKYYKECLKFKWGFTVGFRQHKRRRTVIVEDLRKQMYASKEESTEFVFNVQKDLIVII